MQSCTYATAENRYDGSVMRIILDINAHVHFPQDSALSSSLAHILEGIARLEVAMSQADDKVARFKADVDAQFATLGTALDNIAADEKNILAQLQAIPTGDLSQSSQDALASVINQLTDMTAKSQALADSIPDVPAV